MTGSPTHLMLKVVNSLFNTDSNLMMESLTDAKSNSLLRWAFRSAFRAHLIVCSQQVRPPRPSLLASMAAAPLD